MKNKKHIMDVIFDSKLYTFIFSVVMLSTGIGIVWGVIYTTSKCIKLEKDNIESKRIYNMTHPVIVGTNENGELIKRYDIGVTIYQIGNSRTSVTPNGKHPPIITVVHTPTNEIY